jgi:hypothetical protein
MTLNRRHFFRLLPVIPLTRQALDSQTPPELVPVEPAAASKFLQELAANPQFIQAQEAAREQNEIVDIRAAKVLRASADPSSIVATFPIRPARPNGSIEFRELVASRSRGKFVIAFDNPTGRTPDLTPVPPPANAKITICLNKWSNWVNVGQPVCEYTVLRCSRSNSTNFQYQERSKTCNNSKTIQSRRIKVGCC